MISADGFYDFVSVFDLSIPKPHVAVLRWCERLSDLGVSKVDRNLDSSLRQNNRIFSKAKVLHIDPAEMQTSLERSGGPNFDARFL